MTIFDLLHSAGIKLAKLYKHGKIEAAEYTALSDKLATFIVELHNAVDYVEKQNAS